jgi:DNA invertase Pin-like site-specific DNA recombinase
MTSVPRENYVYIRESKEEAIRPGSLGNYSVPKMIEDCLTLAASHGIHVSPENVVVENAKRTEWDSPKLNAILDRAEDGLVANLISWDPDRLTGDLARSLYVRAKLRDADTRKLFVHGNYDDSDEGDAMESFAAIMAGLERKKTRRRTMGGTSGKLDRKEPVGGGRTPYGIRKVRNERGRPIAYAAEPEQSKTLKRILSELPTRPLAAIADDLNTEGVPTPGGRGRWHAATIYRIVNNATIAGLYRYGVLKFTPSRHVDGRRKYLRSPHEPDHVRSFAIDPIVDTALVAQAKAALGARRVERRSRLSGDEDRFILRGRARCGLCQAVLSCASWGPESAKRRRYYVCPKAYPRDATAKLAPDRCTLKPVPADGLEHHALRLLLERFSERDDLEAALETACDGGEMVKRHDDQLASTRAEIRKLERAIENGVATMRASGAGSRAFRLACSSNAADERSLDALEASLAELERSKPAVLDRDDADSVRAWWDAVEAGLNQIDEQPREARSVLAALKYSVRVRPAGRSEPGAIRLGRLAEWVLEPAGTVAAGTLAVLSGVAISQEIVTPPRLHLALWSPASGRVSVSLSAATGCAAS